MKTELYTHQNSTMMGEDGRELISFLKYFLSTLDDTANSFYAARRSNQYSAAEKLIIFNNSENSLATLRLEDLHTLDLLLSKIYENQNVRRCVKAQVNPLREAVERGRKEQLKLQMEAVEDEKERKLLKELEKGYPGYEFEKLRALVKTCQQK